MIKHIFDSSWRVELRTEEAEPVCGEDFCDSCGDCLACYGCDPCFDGGDHFWVEYEGDEKKQRDETE